MSSYTVEERDGIALGIEEWMRISERESPDILDDTAQMFGLQTWDELKAVLNEVMANLLSDDPQLTAQTLRYLNGMEDDPSIAPYVFGGEKGSEE